MSKDFKETIEKIVIVLLIASIFFTFIFAFCGGFSKPIGYTVVKSLGQYPSYKVIQDRKFGEDRTIYITTDINEAIKIVREFKSLE